MLHLLKALFRFIFRGTILILLSINLSYSQKEINWETLSDVEFSDQYEESLDAYWLKPMFGKSLKKLANETVALEGYYIPVDPEGNFHVLSKFTFASCFFCGAAGPESIVEIQLKNNPKNPPAVDSRLLVKGKLILNAYDFNHCSFILKDAKILSIE